jgi:hypothetical protein
MGAMENFQAFSTTYRLQSAVPTFPFICRRSVFPTKNLNDFNGPSSEMPISAYFVLPGATRLVAPESHAQPTTCGQRAKIAHLPL